jgi:hypothetical protein
MKIVDRILHSLIFLQNCGILWDIYFRHGSVSWSKIIFLSVTTLLLFGLWYLQYRIAKLQTSVPVVAPTRTSTPDLRNETRETARNLLSEQFQRGQWLQGKVPTVGNASEATFCQFWAEEVNGWSNRMSKILWDNYGEDTARDFTSNVGLNPREDVGNTHPEAAAAYRTLVHQLRTFQNIRRTLPN